MDEAATSLLDVAAAASLVCVASFWSIAGLGQIRTKFNFFQLFLHLAGLPGRSILTVEEIIPLCF
jgi:hypothetical protein